MKNIFVEPYTPFDVNGKLLINKSSINWFSVGIIITALIIIGVSFIEIPASLPALVMLIVLAMPVSFALDEWGLRSLYPIKKKRVGINAHSRHDIFNPWYSERLAKIDAGYREKLIEYLDYLRSGGEGSATVEEHLSAWYKNAEQMENRRKETKDKDIASMFINEEQLKAYKKALKEIVQ